MQVVYHAKQSMCAELTTAMSMLTISTSLINDELNSLLTEYYIPDHQAEW